MKDLTIEQKAKAYDKAKYIMKEYLESGNAGVIAENTIRKAFPELAESEDERIRKSIHIYLDWLDGRKDYAPRGEYTIRDMIAWLEKQGEQKLTYKDIETILDIENNILHECNDKSLLVIKAYPKGEDYYGEILRRFNNQRIKPQRMISAEAKEAMYDKPADKVEPKFKVDEWVVYYRNDSSREVLQVYDIRDGRYYFTDNIHFSWSVKECDEKCHLWTIQDAKDGDVLIHNGCTFIFMGIKNGIVQAIEEQLIEPVNFGEPDKDNDYYPATKEQRDLLFLKMHKAGYEWDAEKKKLKKISQRMISAEAKETMYDKPAWSEEDDMMIEETLYFLREYQQSNRCKDESGMQNSVSCEKWLKSIKERIGV